MNHYVLTAILRDFSSNNNDNKREISGNELHRKFLPFFFYANLNYKDNGGYVSVMFSISESIEYELFLFREIHFHVSVVDVTGNKRFTQSLVVFPNRVEDPAELYQFGLERYLKRETLLSDSDELLPDDCLTICVEVDIYFHKTKSLNSSNYRETFCREENGRYILLDTDFGRELCRVSEVFRFASDFPMMESKTRKVSIPEEELIFFIQTLSILDGIEVFALSTKDICDLYRVADKYDIQPVIETCKQFVKALLLATDDPKVREHAAESVPAVMELAEDYRDDDLKETVQTYLESKESFGTNYGALGKHLKEKLHTEWKCKFRENSSGTDYYIAMTSRIIESEFQFYQ